MNPVLNAKREEFDKLRASIETIAASATDGVLTDEQTADSDTLYKRAEDLGKEIETLAKREDSINATAAVLARVQPAAVNSPARTTPVIETVSPGEYISAVCRAHFSGDSSELDTLTRANQTTSDTPGIIPQPIVGSLIKFVDAQRAAVNAANRLPMPSAGRQFTRPRVTQFTQVGLQTDGAATPSEAEFGTLSSRKMTISYDTVVKHTYGGYVDISEQDIDWTDPAAFNLLTTDLAEQYAIATDTVLTAAISAAATTKQTCSLTAAPDVFQKAVASASASVYSASKSLPTTLFAAPDRLSYIQGLTDTTGRPIYAQVGAQNAPGSVSDVTSWGGNVAGLNLVVDPNFAAGTLIVAAPRYVEVYEQDKGLAQINLVSTLGVRIAYRGYFTEQIYSQALVYLAP